MDWNQSKVGYYLDFVLVPILVLFACIVATFHPSITFLYTTAAGFVGWTFAEYWIHRSLFHHVFRRGHWLHHVRPGAYVAAPAWLTAVLHIVSLTALLKALGFAAGAGLFVGVELGYLAYIITHDRIHHSNHKACGWMRRRWEHHLLHHQGVEVNFGVVFNFWDLIFDTYQDPHKGGRFTAKRFTET